MPQEILLWNHFLKQILIKCLILFIRRSEMASIIKAVMYFLDNVEIWCGRRK